MQSVYFAALADWVINAIDTNPQPSSISKIKWVGSLPQEKFEEYGWEFIG